MTKPVHLRVSDLRGFHRLASEATVGLADLVEAMHHTIARRASSRRRIQRHVVCESDDIAKREPFDVAVPAGRTAGGVAHYVSR